VFAYLLCFCIHSLSWFVCQWEDLVSFNGHWKMTFHIHEDRERGSRSIITYNFS
jgi:hypothetical protein